MRNLCVLVLATSTAGCGIVGPSCLDRQERGPVTSFQGEAPAGVTVSHVVSYGAEGSQNDVNVSWTGQSAPDGPRLAFYATRVECVDFTLAKAQGGGACGLLGAAGWTGQVAVTSMVIANGRGNPDILGSPPQFKLWVVGDPTRTTTYSVSVTWFYGPDC